MMFSAARNASNPSAGFASPNPAWPNPIVSGGGAPGIQPIISVDAATADVMPRSVGCAKSRIEGLELAKRLSAILRRPFVSDADRVRKSARRLYLLSSIRDAPLR